MIVTDIDTDRGQAIAADIGGTFARLDVASEADWAAIGELFPSIDVLVNDAGITGFEAALAAHPAAVMTLLWEPTLGNGLDRGAWEAAMMADTPLRRFGRPEEVAALAVLLASDKAAYMTGTELTTDGGILAGSAATPAS